MKKKKKKPQSLKFLSEINMQHGNIILDFLLFFVKKNSLIFKI